jgi:hypothetical protein
MIPVKHSESEDIVNAVVGFVVVSSGTCLLKFNLARIAEIKWEEK